VVLTEQSYWKIPDLLNATQCLRCIAFGDRILSKKKTAIRPNDDMGYYFAPKARDIRRSNQA